MTGNIILVACLDMEDGIGDKDGNLLFHIKDDMKRFKKVTEGNKVFMGRNTWESLPNKPLPNRENFVISNDENLDLYPHATVLNDINKVFDYVNDGEDVYIIGGEQIYNYFINSADKLIITFVHEVSKDATTFFPDIEVKEWNVKILKKVIKKDGTPWYSFVEYTRPRKAR